MTGSERTITQWRRRPTIAQDGLEEFRRARSAGGKRLIDVGRPPHSHLRVVPTSRETVRADDALALTRWRQRHADAFLSRFDGTPKRTTGWLTEVVANDESRIIFLIEDSQGIAYGTMGIIEADFSAGQFELDGVMRGEPAPRRGAMADAVLALLGWAGEALHLSEAQIRVLADNPAVEFYRRLGFSERGRVGLREVVTADGTELVEDEAATAPSLIRMARSTGVE